MNCPHCASTATKEQTKQTSLGYRTFRCSGCKRTFNERTGIPFNFLEYPTDIVLLVVLWRLRFETGKRALPHSWQTNCAPSDEVKQGGRGTLMRPTSTSKGNGVISIGPSIGVGAIRVGKRRWVDTHWDRGLSYLKIGWRWRRQQYQRGWQAFAPFWLDPAPDPLPALASRRAVIAERNSVDFPTAV